MIYLTDFADQAVVLPVAATVLAALLLTGWRRGAIAWAAGIGGVLFAMLVFKLIVFACFWKFPWLHLQSPSGHTAAAAVVYGGLLALAFRRGAAATAAAALGGFGFALLFGLSRLALRVHTVPDVIAGATIGVAGAIILRHLAGERPRAVAAPRLALAAFAAMLLFHGHRLEAETRIRWLALDVWPLSACRPDRR